MRGKKRQNIIWSVRIPNSSSQMMADCMVCGATLKSGASSSDRPSTLPSWKRFSDLLFVTASLIAAHTSINHKSEELPILDLSAVPTAFSRPE